MNSWHNVRVKYTKQFTDGTLKRVSEPYLVNSISFTDAEARIHQEIGEFVRGEFQVTHVSKTDFADIFHYDDAEVWYKCKVAYVSEDLDSGKEKKINNNFLVSAHNVKEAYERIEESLKGLMVSYDISEVKTTKILEIFPYVAMEGEELVSEEEYKDETIHTSSFESEHEETEGIKVEYTEDETKKLAMIWNSNGSKGMSSETMWNCLMDNEMFPINHPYDPDDFSRCYKLLESVPSWKLQLDKLKSLSTPWSNLIENWDKLTEMYEKNVSEDWKNSKEIGMYELMCSLTERKYIKL